MSILNGGQATLGIVWCNDGAASGPYGVGNDTTGDGTPATPYATPDQALQEIRVHEGQVHTTQQWEIRMLSEPGGGEDYGEIIHTDDDVHPCMDGAGWMIFSGWNKAWTISDRGQWIDQADKPGFNNYRRRLADVTNNLSSTGIQQIVFSDVNFFNTSATNTGYVWNEATTSLGGVAIQYFYGCRFDRSVAQIALSRVHGTVGSGAVLIACQSFREMYFQLNGGSSTSYAINCYFYTNQDTAAIRWIWSSGNLQPVTTNNCIFVADGVGIYTWLTSGTVDSVVSSAGTTTSFRNANIYLPKNGGLWAQSGGNAYSNLVFPQGSGDDVLSSQLDPIMVDELTNPQLSNASPAIDKGIAPTAVHGNQDPTGNNLHLRDGLGYRWADVFTASTQLVTKRDYPFTHRGVGPIQNPLIYVTDAVPVSAPVGLIGYFAEHVAGEVQPDPDGAGTGQFRLRQSDDDAGLTNPIFVDSAPEHVVSGNKYIDIQEDGGIPAAVVLIEGVYNTASLVSHIQTRLNSAGLTGTYTVSYNSGTELFTISATGLTTGFELLWLTGANRLNSARRLVGFSEADTAQSTSVDSDFKILENFYDASLFYEWSNNYDGVSDPSASGTWNAMGNGIPSDVGVEGTDGVSLTTSPRYVRVDMNNKSAVNLKFHSFGMWNGNLVSDDTAAV